MNLTIGCNSEKQFCFDGIPNYFSKQVEALFEFRGKISGNQTDVDILRRAMATMQHHDAVTGTEKQHVAEDYAQRMM